MVFHTSSPGGTMLESNINTVRTDLKTLMKDAQELFEEAATASGSKAEELRAKGMRLLDSAIDGTQHLQQLAVEKGKKIAHDTDTYVHEHPWRAIGISAAVGVLVGMLIARR
jgi:ElaB/YqjD/DUF883 family membrane-anchored ribosome-binding protein